jgi:myo-inositol 2-dehydrogenase/D-chiro-inositol 1-dehydrogenase
MKTAMIGAGYIAGVHLNALVQLPEIEVTAHVSPSLEKRKDAVRHCGGRAYSTCEEMLKSETIEAAWINVPPGSHGKIERSFITRRIPMFIEKPLSADRKTAEKLGEEIEKSGLVVGVGYHWRAMDTVPAVREKLAGKAIRMVLASWHDLTPQPTWWRHQETCGGQMVEQVTHLFDISRLLVGEAKVLYSTASRVERASFPGMDVSDVSAAVLQFEQGAKGVFTATCLLDGPAEIHVQLVCEGLFVTLTQSGVTFDYGKEKVERKIGNDPFLAEDVAFLEAVRRGDESLLFSSYQDALKTHELTQDVLERTQGGYTT